MLFSIVSITMNDKVGLNSTLQSIISQDSKDFELIIINGNPVDNLEIENNNFPLIVINENDKGIYDAMNKGTRIANGEYLLYLNSGDSFFSSTTLSDIALKIKANKKRKPDLIYGDTYLVSKTGKKMIKRSKNHRHIKFGMFAYHQSILFSRSLLMTNQLEYNQNYKIASDYEFIFKFCKKSSNFLRVYFPISNFLIGGVSYTKSRLGAIEQLKIKNTLSPHLFIINLVIFALQRISFNIKRSINYIDF
jgi:putative colanic acid biosynthesis glycosyltransferase